MSKFRSFRNVFWAIRTKDIYFDKIQSDFSYFLKLYFVDFKYFEGECWVSRIQMDHMADKKQHHKCPFN